MRADVARWLGGGPDVVDDVCQQVWLEVFEGLARLDQPMAWQAWLRRITRLQVAVFIRRRNRRTVPLDAICDPEETGPILPEEPVDWQRLTAAIGALGEPYESMLRLRYWESYSYRQIADALAIPLGTVRSRLYWARSRLRELLRNEEF